MKTVLKTKLGIGILHLYAPSRAIECRVSDAECANVSSDEGSEVESCLSLSHPGGPLQIKRRWPNGHFDTY